MVAILWGGLALVLGMAILVVPLLATELSRPRDSAWGAVMLFLGLVLITSRDRLNGAPMLGVLCGGLLIGRLALEVGQSRWRQLTEEEQQRLGSPERWQTSLQQLGSTITTLNGALADTAQGLGRRLGASTPTTTTTKRWVRPEESATPVVSSLAEVDQLIAQTPSQAPQPSAEEFGQAG